MSRQSLTTSHCPASPQALGTSETLPPSFYCWGWHYPVWNISLFRLGQLCPLPSLLPIPVCLLVGRVRKREGPDSGIDSTKNLSLGIFYAWELNNYKSRCMLKIPWWIRSLLCDCRNASISFPPGAKNSSFLESNYVNVLKIDGNPFNCIPWKTWTRHIFKMCAATNHTCQVLFFSPTSDYLSQLNYHQKKNLSETHVAHLSLLTLFSSSCSHTSAELNWFICQCSKKITTQYII